MFRVKSKYIIIFLVFLMLAINLTLVLKGNQTRIFEELSQIYHQRTFKSKLKLKLRNYILFSKVNQLVISVLAPEEYSIREKLAKRSKDYLNDPKVIKLNREKGKAINHISYKEGCIYLNFSQEIYKYNIFEQFFTIESYIRLFSDINEVESIQFLIDGRKLNLSPYLNITKPIKVRTNPARIAMIIDDFGNRAQGTDQMLALEQKITCAIMPFKERSSEEEELAIEHDFEVIIHLPMETEVDRPEWLGVKPILTNLETKEIKKRMREAISELPQAIGFNNHTGDKATADTRVMRAVLEVVKDNNLIAIDSRTTPKTVVRKVAEEVGVKVLERDVFLDHQKNYSYIRKAILNLTGKAIVTGRSIGIGHVGPHGGSITVLALQNILPAVEEAGIEFVGISELIED